MLQMIPSFLDKSLFPHKPGVYIFKNSTGEVLYVGKAIDLYHRVASYFSGTADSAKTAALVEHIRSCETIEVLSELEALILEANLIKKYLPPYNIRLTDDKDYLYIKVTNEEFPKIVTARKKELDTALEFFGPFPSGAAVRSTLKKLRHLFPWCSGGYRGRACFYHHLGLCPGPCAGKVAQKEYMENIKHFIKFMQGKKDEVLEELKKEMDSYSKDMEYEKAQQIKRTVEGIEYLTQSIRIDAYLANPNFVSDQNKLSIEELKSVLNLKKLPGRIECYDISNIGGKFAVGSLVVLTDGEVDKKWYRKFKVLPDKQGKPNDFAMMAEVIRRRLKHAEWPMPDLILVDGGRGQVRAALSELDKKGVAIPVFGLAKRMEWLYPAEGEVVKLPKRSLGLKVLQKIRDEAHRFAITYHRKLREASVV